jgi:hypothetical protein
MLLFVPLVGIDRWKTSPAADAGGSARLELRPANFLNTSNVGFQQGRSKDRKTDKGVEPLGTYIACEQRNLFGVNYAQPICDDPAG